MGASGATAALRFVLAGERSGGLAYLAEDRANAEKENTNSHEFFLLNEKKNDCDKCDNRHKSIGPPR